MVDNRGMTVGWAEIAARFDDLPKRREGGKLHVRDWEHPLARRDGWVVAARWVLAERWRALGVERPRCETPGCGRRIAWSKRRTQRVGRLAAVVPWFLDGDPENLVPENVIGVCASCAQRGTMAGRLNRDGNGRFLPGDSS